MQNRYSTSSSFCNLPDCFQNCYTFAVKTVGIEIDRTSIPKTSKHSQFPPYLAPHHILASLVKGRWIDGKAQTVALLRFTCDTPAFFISPYFSAVKTEGLLPLEKGRASATRSSRANYGGDCPPSAPSMRFSALSLASHYHPCLSMNALPVSHPHYPLLSTITLASPRKRGGGLTARHKPKFYSVFMGYIRLL